MPRLRRRRPTPRSNLPPAIADALRSPACRIGFVAGFAGGCLMVLACFDADSQRASADVLHATTATASADSTAR